MRSWIAWLAGGFGLAALAAARALRLRRRRTGGTAAPVGDERADALRRKLAESRALVEEREEFEGAETPVDAAEPVVGDPDERRRAVHGEARASVEQMRRASLDDSSQ